MSEAGGEGGGREGGGILDKFRIAAKECFEGYRDPDEPLLEFNVICAELAGIFDPINEGQFPFVEIYQDWNEIGETTVSCTAEGYASEETSLRPVWNQRFLLRPDGARYYRFRVCIDHVIRNRTVVGEAGFAAADAWRTVGSQKGPVALSVQLIRHGGGSGASSVAGVLHLVMSLYDAEREEAAEEAAMETKRLGKEPKAPKQVDEFAQRCLANGTPPFAEDKKEGEEEDEEESEESESESESSSSSSSSSSESEESEGSGSGSGGGSEKSGEGSEEGAEKGSSKDGKEPKAEKAEKKTSKGVTVFEVNYKKLEKKQKKRAKMLKEEQKEETMQKKLRDVQDAAAKHFSYTWKDKDIIKSSTGSTLFRAHPRAGKDPHSKKNPPARLEHHDEDPSHSHNGPEAKEETEEPKEEPRALPANPYGKGYASPYVAFDPQLGYVMVDASGMVGGEDGKSKDRQSQAEGSNVSENDEDRQSESKSGTFEERNEEAHLDMLHGIFGDAMHGGDVPKGHEEDDHVLVRDTHHDRSWHTPATKSVQEVQFEQHVEMPPAPERPDIINSQQNLGTPRAEPLFERPSGAPTMTLPQPMPSMLSVSGAPMQSQLSVSMRSDPGANSHYDVSPFQIGGSTRSMPTPPYSQGPFGTTTFGPGSSTVALDATASSSAPFGTSSLGTSQNFQPYATMPFSTAASMQQQQQPFGSASLQQPFNTVPLGGPPQSRSVQPFPPAWGSVPNIPMATSSWPGAVPSDLGQVQAQPTYPSMPGTMFPPRTGMPSSTKSAQGPPGTQIPASVAKMGSMLGSMPPPKIMTSMSQVPQEVDQSWSAMNSSGTGMTPGSQGFGTQAFGTQALVTQALGSGRLQPYGSQTLLGSGYGSQAPTTSLGLRPLDSSRIITGRGATPSTLIG